MQYIPWCPETVARLASHCRETGLLSAFSDVGRGAGEVPSALKSEDDEVV
jgi:hypothetical protein